MNKDIYEQQLSYSKSKGFYIHPGLERNQVKGLWGMFAREPIKVGSTLASFPKRRIIPINNDFSIPKNGEYEDYYVQAAKEVSQGEASDYASVFLSFDSIDELKEVSCYYLNQRELKVLNKLSPALFQKVTEFNVRAKWRVEHIKKCAPEVSMAHAVSVVLNSNTRGWGEFGFFPSLDQFNHSEMRGDTLRDLEGGAKLGYITKRDLQPGDQAFISYNKQDLYKYAISYNFFDPTGIHYIDVGYRLVLTAKSDVEKRMLGLLKQKYPISEQKTPNGIMYKVEQVPLMIQESGPSKALIEFISETAIKSESEFSALRCTPKSFDNQFLNVIDLLLNKNHVEKFTKDELPPKYGRFYDLLKKERQLLLNAKGWILQNSKDHIITPDLEQIVCGSVRQLT